MHLMCLIISCLFFSSPALLVPLFTYDSSHHLLLRTLFHTIPCLFHSSSPSFTYDSSHHLLLRTLFHTIPCLFHSSSPSFYVRFLSSSASSYAFPHHSLPLPLFQPIFLRTIPLIHDFFVCPINFTPTFLILFSLIYLLKVLLFIFQ